MNTVRTPKGTELPLVNLKGKDYLQVAHRLVWFNEATDRFDITTDFLLINDDQSIARAKVNVYNKEGVLIKSATATKRETKKDFPDFTEKSETGAVGRALALLGFGTQFAISDLEEGNRLADAPLVNTKTAAKAELKVTTGLSKPESASASAVTTLTSNNAGTASVSLAPAKISTFRKNKPAAPVVEAPTEAGNGWE